MPRTILMLLHFVDIDKSIKKVEVDIEYTGENAFRFDCIVLVDQCLPKFIYIVFAYIFCFVCLLFVR